MKPVPPGIGFEAAPYILSDHHELKWASTTGAAKVRKFMGTKQLTTERKLSRQNSKRKLKIFFIDLNEDENTTKPNLWDTIKTVLRGTFIALSAYAKRKQNAKSINVINHTDLKTKTRRSSQQMQKSPLTKSTRLMSLKFSNLPHKL